MDHSLHQVRLLSRLGKLPFTLLKTTAVIPFPLLVHSVKRPSVFDGLKASCTLLVLEIIGKPHTGSPRRFRTSPSSRSVHPSLRPWPLVSCLWFGMLFFNQTDPIRSIEPPWPSGLHKPALSVSLSYER